jgi:hypothetical protein
MSGSENSPENLVKKTQFSVSMGMVGILFLGFQFTTISIFSSNSRIRWATRLKMDSYIVHTNPYFGDESMEFTNRSYI